tara:strand:+ start:8652 stop:9395 length:744 start_codon:yes stop_codon:yes gene_type:complete
MKIGLLIPSTSKGRDNWKTYKDTYLYVSTLKTFLLTYNKEHEYVFYIGIDKGDRIYDDKQSKEKFYQYAKVMKSISIKFVYMDGIKKGHLTVMWNRLFKIAYDEGCDYFFQCGDDIEFKTDNWVNDCIDVLQKADNVGLTGPINNNPYILTQSFVSRKHMDIFGYYFPEEIINWFCDDWYNSVYKKMNCFYPLRNHYCANIGGQPRYDINNEKYSSIEHFRKRREEMGKHCEKIVERDYERIKDKIK